MHNNAGNEKNVYLEGFFYFVEKPWGRTVACTFTLYRDVRNVNGNDQDYLRKIPRAVGQISALL